MGFRATEINALLRAAQIEHERHARAANAANLKSNSPGLAAGRERPGAASRA